MRRVSTKWGIQRARMLRVRKSDLELRPVAREHAHSLARAATKVSAGVSIDGPSPGCTVHLRVCVSHAVRALFRAERTSVPGVIMSSCRLVRIRRNRTSSCRGRQVEYMSSASLTDHVHERGRAHLFLHVHPFHFGPHAVHHPHRRTGVPTCQFAMRGRRPRRRLFFFASCPFFLSLPGICALPLAALLRVRASGCVRKEGTGRSEDDAVRAREDQHPFDVCKGRTTVSSSVSVRADPKRPACYALL